MLGSSPKDATLLVPPLAYFGAAEALGVGSARGFFNGGPDDFSAFSAALRALKIASSAIRSSAAVDDTRGVEEAGGAFAAAVADVVASLPCADGPTATLPSVSLLGGNTERRRAPPSTGGLESSG